MIKNFLDRAFRFKWVSISHLLGLGLVLGGWIWAFLRLKGIEQPLIIHFNNYVGITRTGSLLDVAWLGVFGLLAVFINMFIALEMEEREWFWGKVISLATILLSGLIFIGFVVIMSVN